MSKGTGKFILGTFLGLGIGLLVAPKKGEETRKDLKKKLDEYIDYAQEIDPEEVKEKITKKAKEIEQEVKDLNGEKVARIAKEKAKMIENKCNDLVDLAISVSEPAIETMAEELRKKTIKSLKEITKKLENND